MKAFLRQISPVGAVKDFSSEFSRPTPYRWHILGVSVAATFFVFMMFIPEDQLIEPRRPEVTYITSYAPGRSDEEIMATNIANQERKEALAAEQAEREELRKDMYRALGRATGLDVDAMEAEIERERAANENASQAIIERNRALRAAQAQGDNRTPIAD